MIVDPRATAFCQAVIGKAHAPKGCGPDEWSCAGLTKACQFQVFGRALEIIDVDETSVMAVARAIRVFLTETEWPLVTGTPSHGDVVFMSRHNDPHHVGTFLELDRGGILHSASGEGVRFDPLVMIPLLGWSRLTFHRPVEAV